MLVIFFRVISVCESCVSGYTHSCGTHNPNYCELNQSYTLATEGCQVGQERIYLNVTRVSLAQLPGGVMERVCLWLFCPLTSVPHSLRTIDDSFICLQIQPERAARTGNQLNIPLHGSSREEAYLTGYTKIPSSVFKYFL